MIYDCFLFFNELDLLDIRLHELNPHVDRFVLVEADKTYSNQSKPLYYVENKHLFKEFKSKITHVCITDYTANTKANEVVLRNGVLKGLTDCCHDDIVLISDVDEIPNLKDKILSPNEVKVFEQKMYYYYINNFLYVWKGTTVCNCANAVRLTPQGLRSRNQYLPTISGGGWHFSYMGGVEKIKKKIETGTHPELLCSDFLSEASITDRMQKRVDLFKRGIPQTTVPIDDTYPKYLLDNLDTKFKHLKG